MADLAEPSHAVSATDVIFDPFIQVSVPVHRRLEQSAKICRKGGGGLLLPLGGDWESELPDAVRLIFYLIGLLWCFMGVAIIADIFMGAIERITSKKVRTKCAKTGKHITAMVWNATVANLTLMALGSSAPEILLSVIELFGNDFFSGELGPSTIVGSAAFNLLCITAVCVSCIPDGEVRKIKEMPVYIVTAVFSIFAYLWLVLILTLRTENVVEIWEGVLTFMFFPVLVVLAFLADKGYFSGPDGLRTAAHAVVDADITREELAALELKIRQQHGDHISEDQVRKLIEHERQAPKSRATYRVAATRGMTGGKRVEAPKVVAEDPLYNVVPTVGACADVKDDPKKLLPSFEFLATHYTVLESAGVLKLPVVRTGDATIQSAVMFATRENTAKAPQDYIHVEGRLDFRPNETKKEIEVKIIDDTAFEQDEDFFVDLKECEGFASRLDPAGRTARVVIIDDDEPGVLSFRKEQVSVIEASEDQWVDILVDRRMGGTGTIGCSYSTEDDTAIKDHDYEHTSGMLSLESGQMQGRISVKVKAVGRYERTEMFRLILEKPTGGAKFDETTDGGKDSCVCSIYIESDKEQKERVDRLMDGLKVNWDKARVGHNNWKDQFIDAIYVNGGGDEGEDDESPSPTDFAMHVISLPWKLLFAFVPPTDFCDGWVCFVSALAAIGIVTAIIGDMAGLLGCVIGMQDSITAITFVALGTSLPDTFASKAAAEQDPFADASVGNVTGSNSVNVFLGLGLPWMIGAFKWRIGGPTSVWDNKYLGESWVKDWRDDGIAVFVVEAGSLSFSVIVFSSTAIATIVLLYLRRITVGGELGGPTPVKYATSAFLVMLWFVYLGLSAYKVVSEEDS